jgi:MFS family permease
MIHALGYEPQGQRQRFEPREQQEQDRHIHLHFHLNLTFRARRERSTHPNAFRLRRIFAALLAATAMPLLISPLALQTPDGPPPTTLENLILVSSYVSVVAGLALAWCAIGLLLWVWRTRPFGRLGLLLSWRGSLRRRLGLPLLLLLLIPIAAASFSFATQGAFPVLMLVAIPFLVVFIAHPLLTALLLMWVSREAGTLRQQAPMHSKLGFVVVGGMVLMLLGGILFNIQAMLGGGIAPLIYLLPICSAVIVAILTLFGLFRSRENRHASPKDASLSDALQEPREDWD